MKQRLKEPVSAFTVYGTPLFTDYSTASQLRNETVWFASPATSALKTLYCSQSQASQSNPAPCRGEPTTRADAVLTVLVLLRGAGGLQAHSARRRLAICLAGGCGPFGAPPLRLLPLAPRRPRPTEPPAGAEGGEHAEGDINFLV